MWRSTFGLLFFCVFVTLYFSGSTDADLFVKKTVPRNVWAATTLDFSNKDTANEQRTNSLFNINGLLPGGFQVKSIRIKNEGKMRFSYWLSVQQLGGDDELFNNLKIKVMRNWSVRYEGNLATMNIKIDDQSINNDDWIMVIGLENKDEKLSMKEVNFSILFKTNNEGGKTGFYVEQILDNKIVTGVWKID